MKIKVRNVGLCYYEGLIYPSKGIFNCCMCGKKGLYLFYPEVCNKCFKGDEE